MEDNLKVNDSVMNNEQKKKRKSFPVVISLTVLLFVAVFGILCGTGVMPVPVGNGQLVDIDTAKLIKNASNVQDEDTLRQLLLLDMELDITVTNDMKVKEGFLVYGKKTLRGDATISADFFGKFEQISVFTIQKGASLTMDGLVIDGDGLADGFSVAQKAELTYLSGTLQKVHQGIVTNGLVTIEDINLHTIGKYGINALFKSDVYLNGGKIYNSGTTLLYVDSMANVEMREGCELFGSRGYIVSNVGTLKIYGGTISTSYHGVGIYNQGKLEIDYKGEAEGGMITISDTAAAAIIMDSNQDCYISDVRTSNIGKNGIWVSDLKAKGALTVENCVFDGTGMAYGSASAISLSGIATVKDVVISNATEEGFYIRKDSKVKLENIYLENINSVGINNFGGKVDAKNITIKGVAYGVSLGVDGNFVGTANIEGLTISEAKKNNIQLYKGAKIRLKDAVLEKSIRTSVYVAKESEVELENVEIKGVKDRGLYCFEIREDVKATILGNTVITGGTARAIGICENAVLTMKSGTIKNITSSFNGAAMILEKGATFNMLGGTITNNYSTSSGGAIYVSHGATFNMKGGTISNNQSEKNGGGGVQLQGTMNFSGGTIKNNISGSYGGGINVARNAAAKTYGKLNMTGGTISGNKAALFGGGMLISTSAEANISGGTFSNNVSKGLGYVSGNGIYDEGNLTISNKAYFGKDVITLASSSITLNIKGNSLSKHNASNPLLVGVARATTIGKVVVKGDSEQAVNSLLTHVISGNRAYTLCKNEKDTKTMTVTVNAADMDMTGADKVYVTSFKELKDAVETTTSKRYIIIGADIVFDSDVIIPDGTTVYIRDDGQPRTFSRAEGYISNYFRQYYGTGFYLVATSYGNLKLDGTLSGNAKPDNVSAFMDLRGTTEIRNIAFENNKSLRKGKCGSFIYQEYGDTAIYSSTFTGGLASYGGAIYLGKGNMLIDDCIFEQNEAIESGGALCVVTTGNAEVIDTAFVKNTAKLGGAVTNSGGEMSFVRKTNSNTIFSENIATGTRVDGGGCVDGGGAIYVQTGTVSTIDGYTFTGNKGQDGGAIVTNYKNGSTDGRIKTLKNCSFYNNEAVSTNNQGGRGGAIYHRGLQSVTLVIEDCVFGGTDEAGNSLGNKATSDGGAIWANRTFEIKGEGLFENNYSSTAGGAVYMTNANINAISGQIFKNNSSVNGGALYINHANAEIELKNAQFISNETTNNGGAIYSKGKLNVSDTEFNNSTAKAGGAVYIDGGTASFKGTADSESAVFSSNTAVGTALSDGSCKDGGGAIYVQQGEVSEIDGYKFVGNKAQDGGAIVINYKNGSTDGRIKSLKNSYFYKNEAIKSTNGGGRGGAIYHRGLSTVNLEIENCVFGGTDEAGNSLGNKSTSDGGAIWANRTFTMKGEGVFENNYSSTAGGAVYMTNANKNAISGQTFKNNSSVDGGALYVNHASAEVELKDTEFISNKATNNGGAVYSKGILKTSDTEFNNNSAKVGGAAYIIGGTASFNGTAGSESAIFSGNTATGSGGAIHIATPGKVSTVAGYIFSGNRANTGGAIEVTGASAQITESITNCKFIQNTASSTGGAIRNNGATSATLIVKGCEFESNTGSTGGAIWTNRPLKITGEGLFKNNTATSTNETENGGAIYIAGGTSVKTVDIVDQTFQNNNAANVGSAVCNHNGTGGVALTITNSKFVSADGAKSPVYTNGTGTTTLSNVSFSGGNKEVELGRNHDNGGVGKVTISGKITDAVLVYKHADALVTVASTGIDEASTISLKPIIYTDGTQVLGCDGDSNAAKEALANAAKIIEVVQDATPSGAKWCNITSEGKLGSSAIVSNESADADYDNLVAAVNEAPTGATIYVNSSETIANTITIDKAVILKTSTEGVTLTRGNAAEMFNVTSSGSLTIEGDITLDGNKATISGTNSLIVNAGTLNLNDGVVVKNASYESGNGGAVYSTGTLDVTDVKFQDNTAKAGGAVCIDGGTASFKGTASESAIFSGNTVASDYAGAIYVKRGEVSEIDGYTFEENQAKDGGAIALVLEDASNYGRIKSLKNSYFYKNTASYRGGAIYHSGYTGEGFVMENCVFGGIDKNGSSLGNTATTYGGAIWSNRHVQIKGEGIFESNSSPNGGAIYITGNATKVIIKGQTFGNNSASTGGALCINNEAINVVELTDTEFISNTVTENGGAIYTIGKLKVTDVKFQENTAKNGGAITTSGEIILEGTSFTDNSATSSGGAIYISDKGDVSTMSGCTFTGNTATDGGAIGTAGGHSGAKISGGIVNSAFYKNAASNRGGAIYYQAQLDETLVIENCVFGGTDKAGNSLGNTATTYGGAIWANRPFEIKGEGVFECNSSANGGAIYATNGNTYKITGQTFNNNSATSDGGAICFNNSGITGIINDSDFVNNIATKNGGAIYNIAKVTIDAMSTFTGNQSKANSDNVTKDGATIAGLYKASGASFAFQTETESTE